MKKTPVRNTIIISFIITQENYLFYLYHYSLVPEDSLRFCCHYCLKRTTEKTYKFFSNTILSDLLTNFLIWRKKNWNKDTIFHFIHQAEETRCLDDKLKTYTLPGNVIVYQCYLCFFGPSSLSDVHYLPPFAKLTRAYTKWNSRFRLDSQETMYSISKRFQTIKLHVVLGRAAARCQVWWALSCVIFLFYK